MAGRKPNLVFGALLALVFLTGMGARPPVVGGPAPPFELKDTRGNSVRLSDYRGKVVLLNFWATWCEPCKKEMPEIQAAHETHEKQGLVVLAVNFGEKLDQAASFAHHGQISFAVLLDPRANTAAKYGVTNLPVTFFIDENGIVRERVFGGTLTKESITGIFTELSGAAGAPASSRPAS